MIKDMFGREVKEGDIILYPTRQGNSLDLKFAVVIGFTTRKEDYSEDSKVVPVVTKLAEFWRGRELRGRYRWESESFPLTASRIVVVNDADIINALDNLNSDSV